MKKMKEIKIKKAPEIMNGRPEKMGFDIYKAQRRDQTKWLKRRLRGFYIDRAEMGDDYKPSEVRLVFVK